MNRTRTPVDEIQVVTTPSTGYPHEILGVVIATVASYEDAEDFFDKVADRMRKKAYALGADAIVSVSLCHGGREGSYLTGIGTAVLVAWPNGHGDPEINAERRA